MNAYVDLLAKARQMLTQGRNREVMEKHLLEDPSFEEYLRGDSYNKRITPEQRLAFARKIIVDAIMKEARRLV